MREKNHFSPLNAIKLRVVIGNGEFTPEQRRQSLPIPKYIYFLT